MKNNRGLKTLFIFIFILWGIFSFWFLKSEYNYHINKKNSWSLQLANSTAINLDGEMIKQLSAVPEDVDTLAYKSVKKRISRLKEVDSNIEFVYLMLERDGQIYFMVDSELPESESYSPPGQHFFEADKQIYQVFSSGQNIITSPASDRWGVWISALSPIKDEKGDVFAVLGIDYPADTWMNDFYRSLITNILMVLFVLILIINFYLFFRKAGKNRSLRDMYQHITESISDVIWQSDLDLNLKYVSSSASRVIGWNSDSFLKSKLEDRISKESLNELRQLIAEELKKNNEPGVDKKRGLKIEVEHYKEDKSPYWAELRFSFIYNEKGEAVGIQGLTSDISDRKSREYELNKIMKSVEQNPASIVITDVDGNIEYVNPKFVDVTGYSFDEAIGQNPRILKSGHTSGDEYKKLWETILSGRTWRGEFYNRKKNGDTYWEMASISPIQNDAGKIINFVAVKEDITARKIAEQKLIESNSQYESLTSNLLGVAYRCLLDKHWTMLYISDHIKSLSGYPANDFLKNKIRSYASIIHNDDKDYVDVMLNKAIKNKKHWDIEYRIISKDQKIRWVKERGRAVFEGDKVEFLDGIIVDISQEKIISEKIKESEDRYSSLSKQSRSFVWEVDSRARYVYVSDNVKDVIGYSVPEIIGKQVFDFHPKKGLVDFKKGVLKTLKNKDKIQGWENEIIRKDGSSIWVSTSGYPVLDDKGKLLVYRGVDVDISNKKAQEEKIKKNFAQQKFLSKITTEFSQYKKINLVITKTLEDIGAFTKSDRVYIFQDNPDGLSTSNTFEWCNKGVSPQIKKMQNLPYDDIPEVKKCLEEGREFTFSDISKLSKKMQNNLKAQGIQSILILPLYVLGRQFGFIGLDQVGSKRDWSSLDIHLIEIISRSISSAYERERALEDISRALSETEIEKEKINNIVQGIGDGVFVLNKDLEIILFNKQAVKISGFEVEDVLGKKYFDILEFVDESSGIINDSFIKKAFSTGKIQKMSNHTMLIRKDRSSVAVEDSSAPLRDRKGNIVGCAVVFRDVTKEREVEKIKSEFVSVVSHQLKTPLTGIKWMSELLLSSDFGETNRDQKEFLDSIYYSNERMIKLVNDLLNISRIETGRKFDIIKEKVDIVKIVGQIIIDNARLAEERKVKIVKCAGAPDKLIMNVDSNKIEQVFGNLINNAIKYSKKGGQVKISCEHKDKKIIFRIQDDGIGIPKEQQDRIFSKFFRAENVTHSDTDGTGLGLYIAKAIVEAHNGEIWFESKKDKGTSFFFSLPSK